MLDRMLGIHPAGPWSPTAAVCQMNWCVVSLERAGLLVDGRLPGGICLTASLGVHFPVGFRTGALRQSPFARWMYAARTGVDAAVLTNVN